MSVISLNPDTLKSLKTLVDNPTNLLPEALKALDPDGPWDLLTHRIRSDQVKVVAKQAELNLPLLKKSASDSGALSSQWAWTASVEANAALAMDLLAENELADLGIHLDAGHTLVAYGASLAFGGTLGGKTKAAAWGVVGLAAGAKRASSLRWFVQANDDGTLLDSLVQAQKHFVSPHDLQAMLQMSNRGDWFGLEMGVQGEAQLQIDVNAKAAGTGWTFSIGDEKASVGLSVGLDASFTARRKSDWLLRTTVEPLVPGDTGAALGLRVRLLDTKQTHQEAALSLSAGADFSAVTASAERVLRAAWPALDSDLLDALAKPGTALGSQLTALIDSKLDGPLKDLVTMLVGGEAPATLRKGLVDKLTGGLGDVLDGALGDLAAGKADVNIALAGWLNRLLGQAADAVTLDDQLKAVVNEALGRATQGLEEAIDKLRDAIVGKAQDKVDALLKTLGELGAQFEGALDRLDANSASKAIGDAIQRYAGRREKLLAQLTDASRQKLALTLSSEMARDITEEAVVEVWFKPPKAGELLADEAQRLYHAICAGRLLALPELLTAADAVGAVAGAKGWLLSTAKTQSTQRATLNFFGIQIGNSTTWLREVQVKVDLVTGDLLAARGSGSVETAIVNRWKNRKARLGVLLDLTTGDGVPATLTAALNGAFSAVEENSANRTKVQELLDAYADAIGNPRTDVRLMLAVPSGVTEQAFWRQLTLSIPVTLDAPQWARFAALEGDDIDQTALDVALPLFARRYGGDSLFSNDPVADLKGYAAAYFEREGGQHTDVLDYLKRFPQRYVGRFSASEAAIGMEIPAVVSAGASDRGGRIFLALHRLSATVLAPRRLQALARQARERVRNAPTPVDPSALRSTLDDLLQKMQAALSPVALVSETWLGIGLAGAKDEPVSWPFASFVTTMARLSGVAVPPGFVPVAQVGKGLPVKLLPPA
jgi:hypothetical protein